MVVMNKNSKYNKFMELKKSCSGGIHTLRVDGKTTVLPCGCKFVRISSDTYEVVFCKKHDDEK